MWPQMMARGFKIWILEVEGLYYLCSKNKGADQLPVTVSWSAPLFLHMQNRFFHDKAHILSIMSRHQPASLDEPARLSLT